MRSLAILGMLAATAAADPLGDIVKAQKRGDVVAVRKALDALEEQWAESRRFGSVLELRKLMRALDPKRAGGIVSAPSLARQLLLLSGATNDMSTARDAAKVLRVHAKSRGAGKWAKAMLLYADGLEARSVARPSMKAKDWAKAEALFQKARAMMAEEGWTPLVIYAAIEVADAQRFQQNVKGATDTILALGKMMPAGSDPFLAQLFARIFDKRMTGAHANIKGARDVVMNPFGAGGEGGAGGAGGAGGDAGVENVSKVGRVLRKFPKKKALITVTRTRDGFEIRQGFDKEFEATQKFRNGTHYHSDGGVTLMFWHSAVGLHAIDPTGLDGEPGVSPNGPRSWHAFYFVGRREKWTVTKTGVVVIK